MMGFFKKIVKNYFLIPAIVLSSIIVEAAKKYFSNMASLQDITSTEDPQDSGIQTTAIVLTAGAMVMQLTMISYLVVKSLTESAPHHEENSDSSHEDELEYEKLNEIDEEKDNQNKILTSIEKTTCHKCRNNYCSCTNHCVGSSFSFYLKLICLTNIIPLVIVAGKLGLTTVFASFMKLTPKEFLQDNSNEVTFYKSMTWILPLFASFQYSIYCLLKGAFINADTVGQGIKYKQCNVKCSILAGTFIVSLPSVIAGGFSNYYFTKSAIPHIDFFKGFSDSTINLVSLLFGIINLPAQAIMIIPFAYNLLHDFFKKGKSTSHSSFLKQLSPIAIINITSMLFDAASNLLGTRISIKCMMGDAHIGEIPNQRFSNNTSSVISCPTQSWVESIAYIIASSTALSYLGFNLYQLKMMRIQQKKSVQLNQLKTPQPDSNPAAVTLLRSPGRFSMFENQQIEKAPSLLSVDDASFIPLTQFNNDISVPEPEINPAAHQGIVI